MSPQSHYPHNSRLSGCFFFLNQRHRHMKSRCPSLVRGWLECHYALLLPAASNLKFSVLCSGFTSLLLDPTPPFLFSTAFLFSSSSSFHLSPLLCCPGFSFFSFHFPWLFFHPEFPWFSFFPWQLLPCPIISSPLSFFIPQSFAQPHPLGLWLLHLFLFSSVQRDAGLLIVSKQISCSPLVNILCISVIDAFLKWD